MNWREIQYYREFSDNNNLVYAELLDKNALEMCLKQQPEFSKNKSSTYNCSIQHSEHEYDEDSLGLLSQRHNMRVVYTKCVSTQCKNISTTDNCSATYKIRTCDCTNLSEVFQRGIHLNNQSRIVHGSPRRTKVLITVYYTIHKIVLHTLYGN
jgi:hypothetical protein